MTELFDDPADLLPGWGELARGRLRPAPPGLGDTIARPRSDYDLGPPPETPFDEAGLTPAAVLVGLVRRPAGPTLLLTRRSASLRRHAAQIAFPGGRCDAEDQTPLETALREADEEIGLGRGHIRPLGFLDAYLTGTGYRIVPVVAAVSPDFSLRLNPEEVDAAFEVPLSFALDLGNYAEESLTWKGVERRFYALRWDGHYIWGATAGIIRNLHDRMSGAHEGFHAARSD